jgi:PKD repeat protein
MSSRGTTNANANEWWRVDLGSTYKVTHVILYKYSYDRPYYYKIQSADDYDFTIGVVDQVTAVNETSAAITHTFSPGIVTQYLRLYCTTYSQYIDTYEFEAHGVLFAVPVADFSANRTIGYASMTVQFTDLSTSTPTSWDWDFGDGTPHSGDQNPVHVYTKSGMFSVTLVATNEAGSDTETKTNCITVKEHTSAPHSRNLATGGIDHRYSRPVSMLLATGGFNGDPGKTTIGAST